MLGGGNYLDLGPWRTTTIRFTTSLTPAISPTILLASAASVVWIAVPVSTTLPPSAVASTPRDARSGDKAFAKLEANVRFQGLVVEDGARGLGFAELRALNEIANELHTGLDRVAIGVQHQVVEQGVLPVDAIGDLQGALVGSVVAFDFAPARRSCP